MRPNLQPPIMQHNARNRKLLCAERPKEIIAIVSMLCQDPTDPDLVSAREKPIKVLVYSVRITHMYHSYIHMYIFNLEGREKL